MPRSQGFIQESQLELRRSVIILFNGMHRLNLYRFSLGYQLRRKVRKLWGQAVHCGILRNIKRIQRIIINVDVRLVQQMIGKQVQRIIRILQIKRRCNAKQLIHGVRIGVDLFFKPQIGNARAFAVPRRSGCQEQFIIRISFNNGAQFPLVAGKLVGLSLPSFKYHRGLC